MALIKVGKCLVLNGFSRNSIAIVRSLGAKGILCDILDYDNGKINLFREKHKSKYVGKVHFISKDKSYLDQLILILKETKYEFLFAGGTDSSNFISRHMSQLSEYTTPIAEEYSKVEQVHDKHKVLRLIDKLSIPRPASFIAKNERELIEIANSLNGKAIVKLPDSYASQGLEVFRSSPQEFIDAYVKKFGFNYNNDNFPLIQQLLEGDLYDTTAFSIDGLPKAVLSQKRIVTAWLKGGGGVVNKTTFNLEIIEHTKIILKELRWNGHIEIDWFFNKVDNQFYFIEINPKFWGTTQLTISAGYDYPYWSILMKKGEEIPVPKKYKVGLTYRWLEDELMAISEYSSGFLNYLYEMIKFFFRFFKFNTKYSIWLKDHKPFKGSMKETLWLIFKKKILRK